ncbi:TlpA family protein disulfide reductase [Chitinophaga sancti]|uniref:TlpA family protein disulfide reductase n=1 Tax=Chitinophaga sancti TaxID=1004 RepID=UPI003F78CD6A
MKRTIYLLTLFLVPVLVFGQKQFKVTFILPDSTSAKEISFYHWDIYKREMVPDSAIIKGNRATISASYNTVLAEILAERQVGEKWYSLKVYASDLPASVKISAPAAGENPFSKYTLVNAQDNKKEAAESAEFIKDAFANFREIHDRVGSDEKLYTNPLEIEKVRAARTLAYKQRMAYITKHSNEYFAFSLFMREAMYELAPDELLSQFATIFPANFRESEQGAFIKNFLLEREGLEIKRKAPLFTLKDINNNRVSLADIYSKKTVLLVFWGTFCAGCIQEISMLKELKAQYPKEQFEIISVCSGSPEDKAREMIKEKGMDWVQIINDDLRRQFHVSFLPQSFVIDTKGNLVYYAPTDIDMSYDKMKAAIAERVGVN